MSSNDVIMSSPEGSPANSPMNDSPNASPIMNEARRPSNTNNNTSQLSEPIESKEKKIPSIIYYLNENDEILLTIKFN